MKKIMEMWMMFSIGAAIITGIYGFLQKVATETEVNHTSFIFYAHLGMLLYALGNMILTKTFFDFSWQIFLFALITNVFYVIIVKLRFVSLKFIDSSSYFINYRVLSSIGLLLAGQFIFSEHISFQEYIGVFIGFFIFYLLLEKKYKQESQAQMWRGFLYLIIGVVLLVLIWVVQKFFVLENLDIWTYVFFSGWIGSISALLMKGKDSLWDVLQVTQKKHIWLLITCMLIFPLGMLCNIFSVSTGGDIAIIYKIVSYGLFIPIFLSMIFYKEKITLKKIIAFILTFLSIGLFMG